MLVKPHQAFAHARNMQYAIGAFNVSNLEVAQGIMRGATAQAAPVIIQTSEGAIEYAGLRPLAALVTSLAAEAPVPVIFHLDHGKSLTIATQCIEAGYTSVMIDASSHPLPKNIQLTAEVVDYAHARGVWVEAELGAILGYEGATALAGKQTPDDVLTNAAEAREFVAKTGVDALAVSVGTIHGAFTGQEYIRFELLGKIEAAVPDIPLVLHGASGISDEHLRQAAATNVCKVNVDTELRTSFEAAVKAYFTQTHDKIDPRDILGPARDAVQAVVENKIKLFGSSGKANL